MISQQISILKLSITKKNNENVNEAKIEGGKKRKNKSTYENNPTTRNVNDPYNRDETYNEWCRPRSRGKGHSFREDYFIPRLSRRTRRIPRRSVSVQLKIPIGP